MRGGEAKRVTVNVHDIIGGAVLFQIVFDYYPEYKVEDVYTKLTEKITKEFEDYHSSEVSGGANPSKSSKPSKPSDPKNILTEVIKNKQQLLDDIEIYANNPSIKIAGDKNTLPDGTIVTYKGLYEKIPKDIKNTSNHDVIRQIKEAYLEALVKRVKLRDTPQVSSMQSQPVIPRLEFTVQPSNGTIPVRPLNKGTSRIYNTSGAIIIGEIVLLKTISSHYMILKVNYNNNLTVFT
jgi:hypothetical protein